MALYNSRPLGGLVGTPSECALRYNHPRYEAVAKGFVKLQELISFDDVFWGAVDCCNGDLANPIINCDASRL